MGTHWRQMDSRPRRSVAALTRSEIPRCPGVYAWYRDGKPIYVGKADDLRERIWSRHLGQSVSLHSSSLRRNVAEHLGFGAANDIYEKRLRLDEAQRSTVRDWILACTIGWTECATQEEAIRLEADIKAEWMPPLTKS